MNRHLRQVVFSKQSIQIPVEFQNSPCLVHYTGPKYYTRLHHCYPHLHQRLIHAKYLFQCWHLVLHSQCISESRLVRSIKQIFEWYFIYSNDIEVLTWRSNNGGYCFIDGNTSMKWREKINQKLFGWSKRNRIMIELQDSYVIIHVRDFNWKDLKRLKTLMHLLFQFEIQLTYLWMSKLLQD